MEICKYVFDDDDELQNQTYYLLSTSLQDFHSFYRSPRLWEKINLISSCIIYSSWKYYHYKGGIFWISKFKLFIEIGLIVVLCFYVI